MPMGQHPRLLSHTTGRCNTCLQGLALALPGASSICIISPGLCKGVCILVAHLNHPTICRPQVGHPIDHWVGHPQLITYQLLCCRIPPMQATTQCAVHSPQTGNHMHFKKV